MRPEILMFIIKLVVMGIICFLSILVMSKTRASSWMFLVAGFLFAYVGLILELMVTLGVMVYAGPKIFNISLVELLATVIPGICFITSFILKLCNR